MQWSHFPWFHFFWFQFRQLQSEMWRVKCQKEAASRFEILLFWVGWRNVGPSCCVPPTYELSSGSPAYTACHLGIRLSRYQRLCSRTYLKITWEHRAVMLPIQICLRVSYKRKCGSQVSERRLRVTMVGPNEIVKKRKKNSRWFFCHTSQTATVIATMHDKCLAVAERSLNHSAPW